MTRQVARGWAIPLVLGGYATIGFFPRLLFLRSFVKPVHAKLASGVHLPRFLHVLDTRNVFTQLALGARTISRILKIIFPLNAALPPVETARGLAPSSRPRQGLRDESIPNSGSGCRGGDSVCASLAGTSHTLPTSEGIRRPPRAPLHEVETTAAIDEPTNTEAAHVAPTTNAFASVAPNEFVTHRSSNTHEHSEPRATPQADPTVGKPFPCPAVP